MSSPAPAPLEWNDALEWSSDAPRALPCTIDLLIHIAVHFRCESAALENEDIVAVLDGLLDRGVPAIPALEPRLIEPGLEPGALQPLPETPRLLGVLAGVADEHSRPDKPRGPVGERSPRDPEPLSQCCYKRTDITIGERDLPALIEQHRVV